MEVVFPGHQGVYYDNTTPEVAPEPSGICPANPEHIRRVLEEQEPYLVLACGKQAEKAVPPLWPGPLIVMPHPAWRFMPAELLLKVRELIADRKFRGRIRVGSVAKGCLFQESLNDHH